MKNHVDTMIFHTAICFSAKQIAFTAEEKSRTRISLHFLNNKVAQEMRISVNDTLLRNLSGMKEYKPGAV